MTSESPEFAEELTRMIVDCEARQDKMSEWEQSFIDSVDVQLGKGRSLTARQYEILEKIWEKVTA